MALPVLFGNLNQGTGDELDQNFAALGAIATIPGTIAGTNSLTFSALSGSPAVTALANGNSFVGQATNTNNASVTLAIGALSPLTVYKDTESGPIPLSGGEIVTNNSYVFRYDSTLNSGAGGFHISNAVAAITLQATITFSNTAANASQDQNVTVGNASLAKVGDLVMLGPPTSVIAGVMYMGYVPAAGTIAVRAANITAASLTPTGGTFRIGVRGA